MKRTIAMLVSLACLLGAAVVPAYAAGGAQTYLAVYLGVEQYGSLDRSSMDSFRHRFFAGGQTFSCTIPNSGGAYSIQNMLHEGYVYHITVQDGSVIAADPAQEMAQGAVTSADGVTAAVGGQSIPLDGAAVYQITCAAGGASVSVASAADLTAGKTAKVYQQNGQYIICLTFVADPYTAPVAGTPGLRTLKNYLATAMEPVGTTLYVYGGAWNWQDTGASNQAASIGLPQTWVDFFQSQTANYSYKNVNPAKSYYPFGRWNQYYFAGADCSGYVGWAVYNTMHTQSGGAGYVREATTMAQHFADLGWGSKTQIIRRSDFKPGDIMSMNGHIWICLGACDDGSLVILHSTPSASVSGMRGGGVQINGVGDSENCQAVQLARTYMSRYYPQWYSRYHDVYKNYASYTSFSGSTAGKFSWTIGSALTDPDGYRSMTADEILADLFGETQTITASAGPGGTIQPAGAVRVQNGAAQHFVIQPENGYEIAAVYVDGVDATDQLVNSQYTFALVNEPHTIQAVFQAGEPWFTDVPADAYYYDAVRWAVENGITQGTSAATFGPDETVTRGQAVTFLWRQAGSPAPAAQNPFTDTAADAYYADAVCWAVENNITQGTSQTTFEPDAPVTREQLAVLLYRYASFMGHDVSAAGDLHAYTDAAQVSAYAAPAMQWATAAGLVTGDTGAMLRPTDPAIRAQTVTILMRLCAPDAD